MEHEATMGEGEEDEEHGEVRDKAWGELIANLGLSQHNVQKVYEIQPVAQ